MMEARTVRVVAKSWKKGSRRRSPGLGGHRRGGVEGAKERTATAIDWEKPLRPSAAPPPSARRPCFFWTSSPCTHVAHFTRTPSRIKETLFSPGTKQNPKRLLLLLRQVVTFSACARTRPPRGPLPFDRSPRERYSCSRRAFPPSGCSSTRGCQGHSAAFDVFSEGRTSRRRKTRLPVPSSFFGARTTHTQPQNAHRVSSGRRGSRDQR